VGPRQHTKARPQVDDAGAFFQIETQLEMFGKSSRGQHKKGPSRFGVSASN